MPRDFKYPKLILEKSERKNVMSGFSQLESDCIKPCAAAFKANVGRMGYFAVLPVELAFQSRRNALFQSNALFRATGKGESTMDEAINQEPSPEIIAEFVRQGEEFESINPKQAMIYRMRMGVDVIERMLLDNQGMQSSMDAMLVSSVLESWLFFEALCSDLWVAGVDAAGKTISNRLGVFQGWVNPDEKITPEEAINLEFNAKSHYGSYLRETGKVAFVKLQLIKKFYGAAFGPDAEKLFDSTAGGRILALSKIRNCIVHSAGRIDKDFKKFLSQSARFPELARFKEQSKIELDGELVKTLQDAALDTGLALLRHVDGVLKSGG